MRRYTWYLLALIVVAAAAALVATGTAGSSAHKQGVSGKISIIGKWSAGEQDSFQAVLDAFKAKNKDVDIKYTSAGDNTPQVVSTAVAGGNPPDIASLPQPGLLKDLVKKKALKSIDYIKSTVRKNYAPVWITLGSVNGKYYGLVFKGSNKSTVWYNVDQFKKAGVKASAAGTFPKFLKLANTIRASGAKPFVLPAADGWTLTDLFENIYLRQAGAKKYDLLTNHKIKWTDPSVKAALRTMAQIVGNTANIAGGRSGALQTDFPTSVTQVLSSNPKAAILIEADFVPNDIKDKTLSPIKDYNVFPFPSIKGSVPATVMGGGDTIVVFRDNPAIRALVKFLATPEAQTVWAKRGGFSSPNKGVSAGAYKDPLNRKNTLALQKAKIFRFDMSDLQPTAFGGTAGQGEWKLFQDFVSNPRSVNGIASKLEAAAAKAYKK
jgi:ABC-type glycerol-3-phosphate transport system substrate-binding protein